MAKQEFDTPDNSNEGLGKIINIAIVYPNNRNELFYRMVEAGSEIGVSSLNHFSLEFVAEKGASVELIPGYVEFQGRDDHVYVIEKSETGLLQSYFGLAGTLISSELDFKERACKINYLGSELGYVINEVLGKKEVCSVKDLKKVQKTIQNRFKHTRYQMLNPLVIGVPLKRKVKDIYPQIIKNTFKGQTGVNPLPFNADCRFAVFLNEQNNRLVGALFTKDADKVVRYHEFCRKELGMNRGESSRVNQGSDVEEIAKWMAVAESPDLVLDFSFVTNSKLPLDNTFSLFSRKSQMGKGFSFRPSEEKQYLEAQNVGFNMQAELSEQRRAIIEERVRSVLR